MSRKQCFHPRLQSRESCWLLCTTTVSLCCPARRKSLSPFSMLTHGFFTIHPHSSNPYWRTPLAQQTHIVLLSIFSLLLFFSQYKFSTRRIIAHFRKQFPSICALYSTMRHWLYSRKSSGVSKRSKLNALNVLKDFSMLKIESQKRVWRR